MARLAPLMDKAPAGSTDYDLFLEQIDYDLRAGLPVALGFEAPLFLPVAASVADLTRARLNEPGPWSYGAGAYVTTVGIPLIALTLRYIRSALGAGLCASLDAGRWLAPDAPCPNLLVWEAYVWGTAHCREPNAARLRADIQDAATSVRAFVEWESHEPRLPSSVTAIDPISTVGAAVLWSGLSKEIGLLHEQTLFYGHYRRWARTCAPIEL